VTAVTGRPRPSARRILLWRHGQTSWNAQDRFQGHADIELDDVGRAQATRAAKLLGRLRPDRIVSSDLRRAHDTAKALASLTGLDVTCDPRLRETSYSTWEGMTAAEIDARYPGARDAWRAGGSVRPGGDGELRAEVGARVAEALVEHLVALPPGGLLVAASHGGAVSSGIQTLLGVPPQYWPLVSGLGNCHWSLLEERRGGGWLLEEHNASSLPQRIVGDEA
jgi:glucosyl-3-phosphoglycerate phosphatase